MIKIELDMYQTLAVAVLVLMLGAYLKSKIYFLEKFCIPEWQNFHSMIFCAKYAWYFSLLP